MTIGGLLPAALWIAVLAVAAPARSAEFYSWIDPSGTIVLTDTLNGLPPAMPAASVRTHQFEDRPEPAAPGHSRAGDRPAEQGRKDAPPAVDVAKAAPPAAPTGDTRVDLQEHMDQAGDQMATGQVLTLGVPLSGSSRPGQNPPFGSLRIPPGPGGLNQRLRELQAFQARAFSHLPMPHAPSGPRPVVAGQGQGRH